MKKKLSAALATYNEEQNIGDCLKSVGGLVDEIVVVDGQSADKTVEIARGYGANVTQTPNDPMFHKMKQKAFDLASGEWVLYLDADERVSSKLAQEIRMVVEMDDEERGNYVEKVFKKNPLFARHQKLLEKRDGCIGTTDGLYVAFFFPRLNCFLGKYMRYGGVYPDGVIRLFKKGSAYLPCKDVHEQMIVEGRVGWLQNNLLHFTDPTLKRYLERNSRYVNLLARELRVKNVSKNPLVIINYFLVKPLWCFFLLLIRYKGLLEGVQGIIFALFSALRFPRAYWRYLQKK